jgi:hypothetical protein
MIGTKSASFMFAIEQINDLLARLGSARTFAEYVLALKALGVERYDSYLADGHSEVLRAGRPPRCLPTRLPVSETSKLPVLLRWWKPTGGKDALTLGMVRPGFRVLVLERDLSSASEFLTAAIDWSDVEFPDENGPRSAWRRFT